MFWGRPCQLSGTKIWSLHLFVYFYPSCSHFLYLPAVPFLQRESRGAVSCQGTCISQGGPACSSDVRNPLKLLDFLKKGRIYTFFFPLLICNLFYSVFGLVEVLKPHLGKFIRQYSPFLYSVGSIYKIYSPCE